MLIQRTQNFSVEFITALGHINNLHMHKPASQKFHRHLQKVLTIFTEATSSPSTIKHAINRPEFASVEAGIPVISANVKCKYCQFRCDKNDIPEMSIDSAKNSISESPSG
jgi:hypothetical protein